MLSALWPSAERRGFDKISLFYFSCRRASANAAIPQYLAPGSRLLFARKRLRVQQAGRPATVGRPYGRLVAFATGMHLPEPCPAVLY